MRKHTKFTTCDRHAWIMAHGRYRAAEIFIEGGPANAAGCRSGRCRIWPGADLFRVDLCDDELELDWTVPA